MAPMDTEELAQIISASLQEFHRRRLQKAQSMELIPLLSRKNPYLYKALGIENAAELIGQILESHLKESDETIFGDAFFEPIARIISGGSTSPTEGVDFIIETPATYRAVAVKSGPNVFNASQKRRQNTEFNALRSRLQRMQKEFDPLLGHSYGRYNKGPTGVKNYRDKSGQAFWEELTGDPEMYLKLATLMREEPLRYRDEFSPQWDAIKNRLTRDFANMFCLPDGRIDWEALVRFVSAEQRPSRKRR